MSATILHFPSPLAKAIAAVEHGFYWAIQAYAADRYRYLIEADDMLFAAEEYRRRDDPPLLLLLEDGYARHEFTGQGRG